MTSSNDAPKKFRPERPIHLSRENTTCKTLDELTLAVEKLRSEGWLCKVDEKIRPLHVCFNDVREFEEFKECAKHLGITLRSPLEKSTDFAPEDFEVPVDGQTIAGAEVHSTEEDSHGRVHIQSE